MDHPLDDRKLGCHHWPLRHVQPVHAAVQLFAPLFLPENLFRIHPSQNCKVQIHCTGMPEANSIRKSKTLPKCKAQIYMHRLSLCTGFARFHMLMVIKWVALCFVKESLHCGALDKHNLQTLKCCISQGFYKRLIYIQISRKNKWNGG